MCKRHPSEGNKRVLSQTHDITVNYFPRNKRPAQVIKFTFKNTLFFSWTIKANPYFKLTVFTVLKGYSFLKHIGSYQSLYKHYEFNLLFLKETEKKIRM